MDASKKPTTKAAVVGDKRCKPASPPIAAGNIPDELKRHARWLGWKWRWRQKKWDKPPIDAKTFGAGSSTDPETWCDFTTALAAYESGQIDGIGFALGEATEGLVFSGVDLDDSLQGMVPTLTAEAELIARRFNSYTEISPTGTGIKILVQGRKPTGRCSSKQLGIECYGLGRYFTITGQIVGDNREVAPRESELAWLQKSFLESASASRAASTDVSDDLELARSALQGLSASRADCYEDWIMVGMVLRSVSEALLPDWESWSRQSNMFQEGECQQRWATFHALRIGIGSLLHWAQQDGWKRPSGRSSDDSEAPDSDRIEQAQQLFAGLIDDSDSRSAAFEAIADPQLLRSLSAYQRFEPGGFANHLQLLAQQPGMRQQDVQEIRKVVMQTSRRERRERRQAVPIGPDGECPYRAVSHGIIWFRPMRDDGVMPVPLTNFTAEIVSQITEDDGQEMRRHFEIEGRLRGRSCRFQLPSSQFCGMNWVPEHLGAEAIVYPGSTLRDHARAAIQILSDNIVSRTVYTHLGWRHINDQWCYLHVGGAIGSSGMVAGITTLPAASLANYELPNPPTDDALRRAIAASLRQLQLAPLSITFPLFAATYRASLDQVDFSLGLFGPSGVGKTELAALAQQHFGAGMNARNLPANWSSTGNALETIAFAAKNAMLVVDDFAPTGSANDVQRFHRDADRLLRGQGNAAGRQRLRADATTRPAKWPRGLILVTGEDIPRGQSLRARQCIVEVGFGDLDWNLLGQCQQDAAAGLYAQAMSGFIQWMAPQYDVLRERLRTRVIELRALAASSHQHRRTPEIVSNLFAAIELFSQFAHQVRALSSVEVERLRATAWQAVGEAAARQAQYQSAGEPTARFIGLLVAALASGRAHVASVDGAEPQNSGAWGWRANSRACEPLGERIGWLDDEDLYLEPEAAYAAAQQMGRDGGEPLSIGSQTLHKRLQQKNLLASQDEGRLTVRRTLEGTRRAVLHLQTSVLYREPCQSRQSCQDRVTPAENWHDSRRDSITPPTKLCQETRQESRGGKPSGTSGTTSAPKGSPCTHDYIDTTTTEGRIKVECGKCGQFYGYRNDESQGNQGELDEGAAKEAF